MKSSILTSAGDEESHIMIKKNNFLKVGIIAAAFFMAFSLSACAGRGNTNGNQKTSESTDPVSGSSVSNETAASSKAGSETVKYETKERLSEDSGESPAEINGKEEAALKMKIGQTPVQVDWEDNESVEALKDLAENGDLVIQMSMYGGFEQVGQLGKSLPRNDKQTTTDSGDIVLYSGNQIVVFYGSNSWAYTRLGHISDKDPSQMKELLSNGNVTVTISAKD